MKWLGVVTIVFVLFVIFLLSFAILVVANSILADIEILKFINK
jgi:cell division protein FtsX